MSHTKPHRMIQHSLSGLIVLALLLGQTGSALAARASHTAVPGSVVETNTNAGRSQHVQPGTTPAGLSAHDWASIQSQIAAGPYRTYAAADGGYNSANPAHGWQIHYDVDGATRLTLHDGATSAWQWGLTLTGYGYGNPKPLGRPQALGADNRPARTTGVPESLQHGRG